MEDRINSMTGVSRFRVILNILIIICSIGAWLVMVFARGGMLTDTGLRSLKYFTVLSNIFEGIASIVWIRAAMLAGALVRCINNYY